jgi:hypothetical protein
MNNATTIQTTAADFESTLASLISGYKPTETHTVEYDLDLKESTNGKCVLEIDGDRYIIEVQP